MPIVDFQPVGRRIETDRDQTLLDAAQQAGIELLSLCGGIGSCDTCRIRHVAGELSPPTLEEEAEFSPTELQAGWRLACQSMLVTDVRIDIPPESLSTAQRLQIEGQSGSIALDPIIAAVDLTLDPPDLYDLRADADRLQDALEKAGMTHLETSLPVLRQIPQALRENDWQVRLAVRDNREVVAVLPPGSTPLGFAADIGTTGMAAYLVDLTSGDILARTGAMNPQIAYGEDIISRIVYINEHETDELQRRMVESLNTMLAKLCHEATTTTESITEIVLVGNTAMHHIVAGLPVKQLGEAPYVPVTADAVTFPAALIGLHAAAGAHIYMPPIIAGYVGADHVAMLLADDAWSTDETVIAIDIGTNTEITLAHNGHRSCCSCASGPAFEGAHIRDGMRAAPGAIERVQIVEGQVQIKTIDNKSPVGICGSGILDAVAVMAENQIVDHKGAFMLEHPLVQATDGRRSALFVLGKRTGENSDERRTIGVRRSDVSEIQLAKGAIRAGITILLNEAGITMHDVDTYIIAGAFGTYVDVPNAIRIGMLPDVPVERYKQVGNAAGMGAKNLLVSKALRQHARALVKHMDYIELTTHNGFQSAFMNSMALRANID